MSKCICCGSETGQLHFRALEVKTLHIRGMKGESRIQALGEIRDWSVCSACAMERLNQILLPGRSIVRHMIPLLFLLLAGTVACIWLRSDKAMINLLGPAAVFCALAAGTSTVRRKLIQRNRYRVLPHQEAMRQAAWLRLMERAPKKYGENDLTYIPVDDDSIQGMTVQQLMQEYRLLPAIAKQAFQRIKEERSLAIRSVR